MSVTSRNYLFTAEGLLYLSHRLVEGLIGGTDAMPQFANTKQKVAQVYIETDGRTPISIESAVGSFFVFDANGKIRRGLQQSAIEAMDTFSAVERAQRATVVPLKASQDRRQWERENRWELGKEELDLIASDIWPHKTGGRKAMRATGVAARKPPRPLCSYLQNSCESHKKTS